MRAPAGRAYKAIFTPPLDILTPPFTGTSILASQELPPPLYRNVTLASQAELCRRVLHSLMN